MDFSFIKILFIILIFRFFDNISTFFIILSLFIESEILRINGAEALDYYEVKEIMNEILDRDIIN